METTINTAGHASKSSTHSRSTSSNSQFWDKVEFARFGIISMLLVVLGCVGGFAASYGAGNNIFKLALIAFPTIISLALVLAVSPMRVIFFVSSIALVMDILLLIFQ